MKTRSIIVCFFVSVVAFSCSQGQNKNSLGPQEFADKIGRTAEGTILDVRTPDEFAGGHLSKARNIDWNGNTFEKEVATLDKSKTVFVYCLRGPRSSAASAKLRAMGFREVIELEGGISKWQAAKLPVITN